MVQRRTMYPDGKAVTIDLEFRPINMKLSDNAEPSTMALVMGSPLDVQVPPLPHPPPAASPHESRSIRLRFPAHQLTRAQGDGQKEVIRSHEMLRYSPTLSMLYDIDGQLIQASRPRSSFSRPSPA